MLLLYDINDMEVEHVRSGDGEMSGWMRWIECQGERRERTEDMLGEVVEVRVEELNFPRKSYASMNDILSTRESACNMLQEPSAGR